MLSTHESNGMQWEYISYLEYTLPVDAFINIWHVVLESKVVVTACLQYKRMSRARC
jgi:hypothetical protein